MTRRSTLLMIYVLTLTMGAAATLLTGCESKPAAPEFDNPFDPAAGGGDPLGLSATVSDTLIRLQWDQPQGMGIKSYSIHHSFQRNSDFETVGSVEHTTAGINSFNYANPLPTATHYFKVQVFGEDDSFSLLSAQIATAVSTPPTIFMNDGLSRKTPRRFVDFTITVSEGDSLRVADNPDFNGNLVFHVSEPGQPFTLPWDLGPATANGDTFALFFQAFGTLGPTALVEYRAIADFDPDFDVLGAPPTVGTRVIDLEVEHAGVDSMRFALGADLLAAATWVPGAETYSGLELADLATDQEVFGEFIGDFKIGSTSSTTVTPDLLSDVTFELQLGSDHITSNSLVNGISSARATLMRFSFDPDFSGLSWQTYADTISIPLGEGSGQKTVYVQYRNDWTDSGILTDYVIQVSQAVEVLFLAPTDGDVLRGGTDLLARGLSLAGSGATAVDSVKLDLADGAGFQPVNGTEEWLLGWNVPLFEEDTELNLRARAWAGSDSATATANVTVTQMVIKILEPLDLASVSGGSDVNIAGSAVGILNSQAPATVVVEIDGQQIVADGTDSWSATWIAPEVVAATEFTITATIESTDGSASDSVTVTVVP